MNGSKPFKQLKWSDVKLHILGFFQSTRRNAQLKLAQNKKGGGKVMVNVPGDPWVFRKVRGLQASLNTGAGTLLLSFLSQLWLPGTWEATFYKLEPLLHHFSDGAEVWGCPCVVQLVSLAPSLVSGYFGQGWVNPSHKSRGGAAHIHVNRE